MRRENTTPMVPNRRSYGLGLIALRAAVVSFMLAAACRGGGDGAKDARVDRRDVTPNLSVSLDTASQERPVAEPIAGVDAAAEVREEIAPDKQQPPDATATAQGAAPPQRVPRETAATDRSAATLRPVPWYRTGIGALGIVLAVIAAAVWGLRRWAPRLGGVGCAALDIAGRTALSPKHSVALISIGRRYVLVGMAGDRVSRICEVTDPQEVAELTLRLGRSPGRGRPTAFESLLAGEENEYAHPSGAPDVGPSRATRRRGADAAAPISALLKRLRSLPSRST